MNAEIIAVGSELLSADKVDTNSLFLTDQLNQLGVEVVQKAVVGDHRERLAALVQAAVERSEVIIITGGLGPTEDDVTRDAVALALGRELEYRQEICDVMAERFRSFNRPMADINKRQAYLIGGAEILPNARGTAPGQWIDYNDRILMLLPGPPKELEALWTSECLPKLTAKLPVQVIRTRFYRIAGMGESEVDQIIAPVYTKYQNPTCTILAGPGDIQVHLRARCVNDEEAESLLAEVGQQIEAILGSRVYSKIGKTLESTVGALLEAQGRTLAVAESCTGGLLAARLTSVAGSSKYFRGGLVTYANEAKAELLAVDPDLLERNGAVSDSVARAMASGARKQFRTDYGVSITGVAGPDGGTEATPVGTVFVGMASAAGDHARRFTFPGDRSRVRTFAVQYALDLLRLRLLD